MSDEFERQRRHPRVNTTLPVQLSTIEPERDPWTGRPFFRSFQDLASNLSRGGVFVRTSEPLAPGRRVLVECRLPSGRPVEAIGRVAWSKRVTGTRDAASEAGVGIEFLGGAVEQWSALEEFIARACEGTRRDATKPPEPPIRALPPVESALKAR